MGGPSGGSTGGGGGGVGPAGKKKDGSYGSKKDAKKTSNRNEFSSALVSIANLSPAVRALKTVSGAIEKSNVKAKDRKINDTYLGSSDYQGDVYKKARSVDPRTGRDNDNDNNQKSIEQPKVASQMDNSEVKSDLIMADKTAPTDVEMTDDELLLKRKRGKKTRTILTSVTGDTSKATLSKKVLLG